MIQSESKTTGLQCVASFWPLIIDWNALVGTPPGHLTGSARSLPDEGEVVMPLKIWLKLGTRKLVL